MSNQIGYAVIDENNDFVDCFEYSFGDGFQKTAITSFEEAEDFLDAIQVECDDDTKHFRIVKIYFEEMETE